MTERFIILKKEKGRFDNGICVQDTLLGVTHQMLDEGSAEDVKQLLNSLHNKNKEFEKKLELVTKK